MEVGLTRGANTAKRLEVLLDDAEHAVIEGAAQRQGISSWGWVRNMLSDAIRYEKDRTERKRKALELAAQPNFPTGDIADAAKDFSRTEHFITRPARFLNGGQALKAGCSPLAYQVVRFGANVMGRFAHPLSGCCV